MNARELHNSPAALAVDFLIGAMDRTALLRKTLSDLVSSTTACGHHLSNIARTTAARCAENPAEAVALLRRSQRRLGKAVDAIGTGENDTLAEMTRDGVTIASLNWTHAALGAAADVLEGN